METLFRESMEMNAATGESKSRQGVIFCLRGFRFFSFFSMEIGFPVAFSDTHSDTIGGKNRISCHEMLQLCSILGRKVYFCMECSRVELHSERGCINTKKSEKSVTSDVGIVAAGSSPAETIPVSQNPLKNSPETAPSGLSSDGFDSSSILEISDSKEGGIDTQSAFGTETIQDSIDDLLLNRVIPKASKSQKPKKSKPQKPQKSVSNTEQIWNIEYEIEEKGIESYAHEQSLLEQYLAENPQDAVLLQNVSSKEGDWQEEYEVDPHKYTLKFQKTVASNPEQVIRYGNRPLWYQRPHEIPKCTQCNQDRVFEFQIMPFLISLFLQGKSLKKVKEWVNKLDFVTILIFVCPTCNDPHVIVEKEV
jgi:hypothetical protein